MTNSINKRNKKKVPHYWWDFDEKFRIIIESDNPKYPVVVTYVYEESYADKAIEMAEQMIKDLLEGRILVKNVANSVIVVEGIKRD